MKKYWKISLLLVIVIIPVVIYLKPIDKEKVKILPQKLAFQIPQPRTKETALLKTKTPISWSLFTFWQDHSGSN